MRRILTWSRSLKRKEPRTQKTKIRLKYLKTGNLMGLSNDEYALPCTNMRQENIAYIVPVLSITWGSKTLQTRTRGPVSLSLSTTRKDSWNFWLTRQLSSGHCSDFKFHWPPRTAICIFNYTKWPKAFVQARNKIGQKIYIKLPKFLRYPEYILFLVKFPLDGIPKTVNGWFYTYSRYHTNKLKLISFEYNQCLLYIKKNMSTDSFSILTTSGKEYLRTDDTLYSCNKTFSALDERTCKRSYWEKVKLLSHRKTPKCNGGLLYWIGDKYFVNQPRHILEMSKLDQN